MHLLAGHRLRSRGRLKVGRGLSGVTGPLPQSASTITPTGPLRIGTEYLAADSLCLPRGGGSYEITAREWLVDGTLVQTGPSYTILDGDLGKFIAHRQRATQTGGDADGTSAFVTAHLGTVLPIAPFWDISAGDNSAFVIAFPSAPTTPPWIITASDGSAVVSQHTE